MTNENQDRGFNNGVYSVLRMLHRYYMFTAKTCEKRKIIIDVMYEILKQMNSGDHQTSHRFNSDTDYVRGLLDTIFAERAGR